MARTPSILLTIPTPSVDFHAERRGAHPRAVFVHGFAGDLHTWDALWSTPAGHWDALRYDLRGFGRSPCKEHVPYTHARDLETVLDAAGIEQCDLIGASMGGSIALNFTLDHPERVRRLVLISPGLIGWQRSDEWQERNRAIETLARRGALAEAKRLWWEHPMFASTRDSAAATALWEETERYSGEHWCFDHHLPLMPDIERLHLLKTRTLLLTGALDVEDSRVIADVIAGSAPDVQRIDHPACGHLLHMEDPETCAQRLAAFLG